MNSLTKKTVFIDMDDVLCDFKGAYHRFRAAHPLISFPQSIAGFFEGLHPIPGAIDSVNWLRSSPHYEVYVLTAPSTRNPQSYSEKRIWIEHHFDYEFTKNLIICAHKNLLKGDYLIDDNVTGKGQDGFSGTLIQFASMKYPDWKSVMTIFSKPFGTFRRE